MHYLYKFALRWLQFTSLLFFLIGSLAYLGCLWQLRIMLTPQRINRLRL